MHKARPESGEATNPIVAHLIEAFIDIISETNGITLMDTLDLMQNSLGAQRWPQVQPLIVEFKTQLQQFQIDFGLVLAAGHADRIDDANIQFACNDRRRHQAAAGNRDNGMKRAKPVQSPGQCPRSRR